jgi:hypothetical protein
MSALAKIRSARPTPAQALFLLSPLLGEVVSGHLSPLEAINPLVAAITIVPYPFGRTRTSMVWFL